MKKILITICACIGIIGIAIAETMNINWTIDDSVYDTTTCTIGDDIILPPAPTKRGYTFLGWVSYTPIEYIESTGTQWIDTGVSGLGSGDWELYLKWMPLNTSGPGWASVFGAYTNEQTNAYEMIYNNNNTTSYLLFGNSSSGRGGVGVNGVAIGAIHEVLLGNGYAYLDNVRYNTPTKGNTIPDTTTIKINRGRVVQGRFYASWATKDGVYMYDLIPVLDGNGVACMYDKVSKTFFYNAGTGDFVAGPIIGE